MHSERFRLGSLIVAFVFVLGLSGVSHAVAQTESASPEAGNVANQSGNPLVYHQITNLTEGTGSVGIPILSADGTTAVFTDAPGTEAVETPNRIYVVKVDGGAPTEVDSYQTLCYCASSVDISDDGGVAISTDAVQLRIADGGGARELVRLASGEISAISIAGDGRTVFFMIRRDTQQAVDGSAMPRGVWAVNANGSDIRQLVGAEDVAAAVGAPIESTGCCFIGDGRQLDASSDGGHLVFGGYAGGGENVFTLQVGGAPQLLFGPGQYVRRVAISGDGATVSYDVNPLNVSSDLNEIRVTGFTGGDSRLIATATGSGFSEPLDLSRDGAWLLDSPSGVLYDTVSGAARTLAVLTPGVDSHLALVADGLPRGTLSGDGTRVLYVMHSGRCADCANALEQLATLDIGDSNLGNAPEISGAKIDPTSVVIDGGSTAKATAKLAFSGKLIAFGIVALLDGRSEINISTAALKDDGTGGDTTAGDGLYSADGIRHIFYVARDDDTGPRVLRIQAEVESSDGLHHAIAIDFATLDVVKA